MVPLFKLTLIKFEQWQTYRGLIFACRAKALTVLAQKRDVLTATLEGKECSVACNVSRACRADRKLYQRNWWRYRNCGRR